MLMASNYAPKMVKKRTLRRRDARKLLVKAGNLLNGNSHKIIGQADIENGPKVYIFDGNILLAEIKNELYPTLINPAVDRLPSIIVDMGAVPYVCNGADIMSPGIVRIVNDFDQGDLIVIRDTKHKKILAIGKALLSSNNMRETKKGKVILNLHYVGDKLWDAIK
jgi:PUA domain protein